jgi:hypothetical protein
VVLIFLEAFLELLSCEVETWQAGNVEKEALSGCHQQVCAFFEGTLEAKRCLEQKPSSALSPADCGTAHQPSFRVEAKKKGTAS